jgi:hypothetical protein
MGKELKGDFTIRAGSKDYKRLQLFSDDGVTAFAITGQSKVEIKFKEVNGTGTLSVATDGAPQDLYVIDEATGVIEIRPPAGKFNAEIIFDYVVWVTDSTGLHAVPENKNYRCSVIPDLV